MFGTAGLHIKYLQVAKIVDKNSGQLSIRSTKSWSLKPISIENYLTITGTLERYGYYIKCN